MSDQNIPNINSETTILSFDVESNNLHGEAFAVGAVLITVGETILDEFIGRCPIEGRVDPWVEQNVLPVIQDIPEIYTNTKKLRTAFWKWYQKAKNQADYIIADNSYPVEARFLIACQEDDIEKRYWEHPFPLLDPASMLMQIGIKPLAVRYKFVIEKLQGHPIQQHNPRFDAWVSALTVIKALQTSKRFKK